MESVHVHAVHYTVSRQRSFTKEPLFVVIYVYSETIRFIQCGSGHKKTKRGRQAPLPSRGIGYEGSFLREALLGGGLGEGLPSPRKAQESIVFITSIHTWKIASLATRWHRP